MEDKLNLSVRTEVLNFALYIENGVNELLLAHLGINDKTETKNFGTKAGISFKSKIDLLYDINVLSKDDHLNLELLMNFRNKFLHNIECSSYKYALDGFDKGIQNRFKKFINVDFKIENEDSYRNGLINLYLHNSKMLIERFTDYKNTLKLRKDFLLSFADAFEETVKLGHKFSNEVFKILESDEFENEKIIHYSNMIQEMCNEFTKELIKSETIKTFEEKIQSLPKDFFHSILR